MKSVSLLEYILLRNIDNCSFFRFIQTQIILGFLQLNCFHVFAIQVHDNINEATTGRSNLVTATLETTSVAPNPALNAIQNTTETDDDGKTDPNS